MPKYTDEDVVAAYQWLNSLSLNDWKALEVKHFGNSWTTLQDMHKHCVCEVWVKEGKPVPEELIPVAG